MSQGKLIAGIDLGTNNMRICLKEKGKFKIVENLIGKTRTPSVVSFEEDGCIVVGEYTKRKQITHPETTISHIKGLLGHKKDDKTINSIIKNIGFKVDFDKTGFPLIVIPGRDKKYKPEEILALILKEGNNFVKNKTGRGIDECIITIPGYYDDLQKKSIKKAAEIAGIKCNRVLSEPAAAIIGAQYKHKFEDGKILVFDFGGGELDISILNVNDGVLNFMAYTGDSMLGGEDIDSLIVEEMIKRFKEKNPNLKPEKSPKSMAKLKTRCEEAKCILSKEEEASIVIPDFMGKTDFIEKITRHEFESLCRGIIAKFQEPLDDALEVAGLEKEDIDHIILVGGTSEISFVHKYFQEYFSGKNIIFEGDSDEYVALGAAVTLDKELNHKEENKEEKVIKKKAVIDPEEEDYEIQIIQVQPVSIGIRNEDSSFQKIIFRNEQLPLTKSHSFMTTENSQTFACIDLFFGEDDKIDMSKNTHEHIGKYKITGFPQRPAGEIIITVELAVDEQDALSVTAKYHEKDSTDSIPITVEKEEALDE